ncbi:MAG TPA: hypothetical protein VK139_07205 [Microbacteriaceae bacterium]|nr:hypothetical protein [Microbacteriaceae bacterium]
MVELARRIGGLVRGSWLLRVTLVFLASRVASMSIMLVFANLQGPSSYGAAQPDYVTFANFWDARWYAYIASAGYPSTLPMDAGGHVVQNAWAFLPMYPLVVGGLAALTGIHWAGVAVLVSLVFGWAFLVLAYRLFRTRLSDGESLWSVAFIACAPASPVLGVGYAESMFLFLLALTLWLLIQRRYGLVAVVVVIMAFTRPGSLALALALGLLWVWRWWRRHSEPFVARERFGLAAVSAWSALWGFAWPAIAGVVTGRWDAYLQTELSWRAPYIGWQELAPGTAWFQSAHWWFGPIWTFVLPLAVIFAFIGLVALPEARRLGPVLMAWPIAYLTYLFLVFFPQSSTFRILAPMFPLAGIAGQVRSRAAKWSMLLASIAGQVWWVWATWIVLGSDWTPP